MNQKAGKDNEYSLTQAGNTIIMYKNIVVLITYPIVIFILHSTLVCTLTTYYPPKYSSTIEVVVITMYVNNNKVVVWYYIHACTPPESSPTATSSTPPPDTSPAIPGVSTEIQHVTHNIFTIVQVQPRRRARKPQGPKNLHAQAVWLLHIDDYFNSKAGRVWPVSWWRHSPLRI